MSLRPPWGSAVARWGKNVENRTWPFPPELLNQRIAIHQGKRWTDEERMAATMLSVKLGPHGHTVPMDPDFYAQGIVAVARLAGFVDMRPKGERVEAGHRVEWSEGCPMQHHTAAVIGAGSMDDAKAWAYAATSGMWWIGPVGWLLDDVVSFSPIPMPGKQGIQLLPHDVLRQLQDQGFA